MSIKTLLCAVGALAAAACHDADRPVGPTTDPDVPQLEPALQAPLEQAFEHPLVAKLVATVPGFGGFYLDAGVPTVYLTDVGQRAKAEAALAAYGKVRVLPGAYTYKQLDGWFHPVSREALPLPGVILVDLDEAKNRVFIGVEHAGAAAAARGVAARLGLPAEAVVIEQVQPVHFAVTLRDHVPARKGGLQISTPLGNGWSKVCTLGFNALFYLNGYPYPSFITNSHCTKTQGGSEQTWFYQPNTSVAQSWIGWEVYDPQYWSSSAGPQGNTCPPGRRCRYSDAAMASYDFGVTFSNAIAKTSGPNNSSLDIVGDFQVIGENVGWHPVGMTVNKVGRTTGWTSGNITRACVNVNVAGTDITLLCQFSVQAASDYGDSGSPAFTYSGAEATLVGILWGGADDEFWYSRFSNIELELGSLQTTFRPDLMISGMSHSPAHPIAGDLITFTATVRNSGSGPALASQLEFKTGWDTPGAPQTKFAVPALGVGQMFSVQRQLSLNVAQNYRNTATADVAGSVAESNEANNVKTDDYRVTRADQRNAVDPNGYWMGIVPDNPGVYATKLAQVVAAGVAGALVQVRLPVSCPSYASGLTSLVVEIQGVTSGKPNGIILASQTVPAANLSGPEVNKDIMFSSPRTFAAGDRFAIVLSAVGQYSCAIKSAYVGVDYAGGQGFVNSRGLIGGWSGWRPLANAPYDLAFVTAVWP